MAMKMINELLVFFLDFLKIFFFFKYLLSLRISIKKGRLALASFVYFSVVWFLLQSPETNWCLPLFRLLWISLLLMLHKVNFRPKTVFITILIYLLNSQFDGFVGSLLKLTPLRHHSVSVSIITALISLPLFYLTCRLCAAKQLRIRPHEQTMFLLIEFAIFFLNFALTGTVENILKISNDPFYTGILHFSVSALTLLLDIAGLELFFLWQAVLSYRQTQQLQEQLLKSQDSYVAQVLQQDQILRHFRHDIRGHLTALNQLLTSERIDEAKAYMQKIHTTLDTSAHVDYYTKNPVADALLNDRSPDLKKQGISLTVSGQLSEKLPLSDFDLCLLLFNLLNNAQEACLRLPDGAKRWITLEFDQRPACLYIRMRNPIHQVNGSLHTSKPDPQNHGIGLPNIRRCIEHYHGDLEITQKDNVFQTEIFLYNRSTTV